MSVLNRIQKRKSSEVEIEGELVRIRSLSYFDGLELNSLDDPGLVTCYAIGAALLEDDGNLAIPRNDGESVFDYASRVRQQLSDMTAASIKLLVDAVTKLSKPPSAEAIAKNSDETASPAS